MSISASDLFLSADLTDEEARRFLQTFGFRDPAAADRRLQALADEPAVRHALADLAALLLDALRETPDPDGALAAFVHFAGTRSPRAGFLRYLAEDPRALHVLIQVTGHSAFLGELLIASPEQFHWLVREVDRTPPDVWDLTSDAMHRLAEAPTVHARRAVLRHFHDRELLRIGTREILGRETKDGTRDQLADLAEVVIGGALAIAREIVEATPARLGDASGQFAVLARGATADAAATVDAELIYIYDCDDDGAAQAARHFDALARALTEVLSEPINGSPLQRIRHPAWFTATAPDATTAVHAAPAADVAPTATSHAVPAADAAPTITAGPTVTAKPTVPAEPTATTDATVTAEPTVTPAAGRAPAARPFHALRRELAGSRDGATREFLAKSRLVAGDRALGEALRRLIDPSA